MSEESGLVCAPFLGCFFRTMSRPSFGLVRCPIWVFFVQAPGYLRSSRGCLSA